MTKATRAVLILISLCMVAVPGNAASLSTWCSGSNGSYSGGVCTVARSAVMAVSVTVGGGETLDFPMFNTFPSGNATINSGVVVTIAAGATLTVTGGTGNAGDDGPVNNGTINNAGSIQLNAFANGSLDSSDLHNNGVLNNTGTIAAAGGFKALSNFGTLNNSGSIILSNGADFTYGMWNQGTLTNQGTITIENTSSDAYPTTGIANYGTIFNDGAGTINVSNAGPTYGIDNNSWIKNGATITVAGGANLDNFRGSVINYCSGVINGSISGNGVINGCLSLSQWCVPPNGSYSGGVCTVSPGVTMSDDVTVAAGETLSIPASTATGNYLTIAPGILLAVSSGGAISNSGTAGTGIDNLGEITNSGAVTLSNSSAGSSGLVNNGLINNFGAITVSNSSGDGLENSSAGEIDNTGTITIANSGGTGVDNLGTIIDYCGSVLTGSVSGTDATKACYPTTLSVSLSLPAILSGQSVSASATLSGTTTNDAGGTVTYSFYSGGSCSGSPTPVSTVNVNGGAVPDSATHTFNSAGSYSWQAVYSGNFNNATSTSACIPFTVLAQLLLASTNVRCAPSPVGVHQPSTCTASVSNVDPGGPMPTGTVFFKDNESSPQPSFGTFDSTTCTLSGGTCSVTYTPSTGAGGSIEIAGTYEGDDVHGKSASGFPLRVILQNPILTWSNPPAIVYGTPLGGTQLDATANVPGTFVYTPAAGTILAAGSGQTLSVTFAPADSADYAPASGSVKIDVAKANPAVTVTPYNVTYDGAAHTATGLAKGVLGESLGGLSLTGTTHTNAGAYATDAWTFTDSTGNYNSTNGTVNDNIAKAGATVTVTPYSVTYDGAAHTATGSVTGLNSQSLTGLNLSGTTHTNAGSYANDAWTFTDSTGNYQNASGTTNDNIGKANATVTVSSYNVTYDGTAHTATGSAKGVLNETLAGLNLGGTTHTNAGAYATDAWTFADSTGNYNNANGTVSDNIAKASATVSVAPYNVTYDGAAHTATGSAKGVLGENLSGLTLTATTHTNAGAYTADAWTFTDSTGNYNSSSGTVSDNIAKASATVAVAPYNVTYDGAAHTATGSVKGVLGESLSGLTLTGTTHTNAGAYTADAWTFTDSTGNYNSSSGTVSDNIAKANAAITVTPYHVTYDGAAHTATGSVQGVLGENLSGLTLTATTHTNAGAYTADAWTFTDTTGNYNSVSGTVSDNISKASAAITVTPYNVTYDGTSHTATGSARGVLNETLTGLDLSGTAHTTAGTYASDPWTFTDATGNYNNAGGEVSDAIGKASLTITADDKTRQFGQSDPAFTATYKGFAGSDGPLSLTTPVSLTTLATIDSGVGPYVITASGATSPNYAITFVNGTLTIISATTALTVPASTAPYSDNVTLSASITPATLAGRIPSGTVQFSVDGVPVGSNALDAPAATTLQYLLNRAPGNYSVTATFTSGDPDFSDATSASAQLVVTPEDASATYGGTTFTSTSSTVYVPLHATIQDEPVTAPDTFQGDLHNATVSFVNRDTGEVIASDLPMTFSGSDSTVGTVDFQWPVTIDASPSHQASGANGKSFTVATVVGGWYARNATADDTLVMVAESATHGILSGGGYLLVNAPGGTSAPDKGSRLNFSFNATYQGQTVTGGFVNLIVRSNGHVLRFNGTPAAFSGVPASGRTSVTANGSLIDVTDPANPVALGAAQVQLDVTDSHGGGSTLGITVSQNGSVTISSNWNGTSTQQQPIDDGGLAVH